ncbi:hypothetical protein I7F13_05085 [Sinorhizobium meliloti]|uniref:hypothetical protein n=1 Tax=Sinorhizobium TaxID=28105 RepID=UPI000FD9CFED|nr:MULTISPECIES: hypothetical protein [Sinorhizobium]MDE3821805.1 hypothetical protein [Sinorhizobium meliloti]MDX0197018.1 hypothetical protein [Sinorhizobium meliloti]MDX0370600.1 hypothetical protein [Sinorhizobium meliloti]MQU78026.1 hypothetical protein [Sinorhizobium medicae]RVM26248.1 hypothetical protein CN132_16430 [Sinorhizobium meliloti]
MNNVINFPNSAEFEDLSLAERMIIIESWHEEMEDTLRRMRENVASIEALIEANKRFDRG